MSKNKEKLPELPRWLQELLPEPSAPQRLSVTADGDLELTQPDGASAVFKGLREAYEASREAGVDLEISDEVYENFGDKDRKPFLDFPDEKNPNLHVMVFGYTDRDRIDSLKRGYKKFRKAAKRYLKEPQDFSNAWNFLDSHPAFWTAPNLEENPFYWVQEFHMSHMRVGVWRDKKGTTVALETGSHVPPLYKEHYGDWRLEVVANSYEDAVIELARRVHLTHNLEGEDIEDSDRHFIKPEWVEELEETIAEYEEQEKPSE